MKDWHREHIFAALAEHDWSAPIPQTVDSYEVGEAYSFSRGSESLQLRLVADLGAGFQGLKSVEEAVAIREDGYRAEFWLVRRQNSRWQQALSRWATQASTARA